MLEECDVSLGEINPTLKAIDSFSTIADLQAYEASLSPITMQDYANAALSSSNLETVQFCVVVPSYNNQKYTIPCLNSVFKQDYHNWRMIFIDDASNDGTSALVEQIQRESQLPEQKFKIFKHETRMRSALYSFYEAAHNFCDDNEVMIYLDGDDMLSKSTVMTQLDVVYKKGKIWLTYGKFIFSDAKLPGWSHAVSSNDWPRMRSIPWSTSHLRTSYTWLFKLIKLEDLQYEGEFFHVTWDLALMYPMLEMAGKARTTFINDIIYIYRLHPANDQVQEQQPLEKYIRSLAPYKQLTSSILIGN